MIISVTANIAENHIEVVFGEWISDGAYKSVKLSRYKKGQEAAISEECGSEYVALLDLLKPISWSPSSVTMRQARLALLSNNILDKVDSMLTSSESKINWEYATEVYRNSTLVSEMQTALNLTDEQVDNLFIEASKL